MRIAALITVVWLLLPALADGQVAEDRPESHPSSSSDTYSLTATDRAGAASPSASRLIPATSGTRSYRRVGAGIGFVTGAGGTYLVLRSGGSTGMCNHSANQDAIGKPECVGLAALGGLAGAGLGALVGGRFHNEHREGLTLEHLRLGPTPEGGLSLGAAVWF